MVEGADPDDAEALAGVLNLANAMAEQLATGPGAKTAARLRRRSRITSLPSRSVSPVIPVERSLTVHCARAAFGAPDATRTMAVT